MRKYSTKYIASFIVFLTGAGFGHAATKYVNNGITCADSPGNGSAASPFCTVGYGVTQISSGDTLYVRTGTYTISGGYLGITGPSGTSAAHTVISAYPGDTVNLLPTDSSTKLVFGTLGSCTPVSYMDFSGFTMYSSGGNTWETAVTVNCGSNIKLSNLIVHDIGQEAIHITDNSSYVTLTGSTIYNTGTGTVDGEGVYVGSSTSVSTVDNTNNVTITANTIYNTKDEGVELKPGTHDCLVDGNTLYHNNSEAGGYGGASIEVNEAVSAPQQWNSNPNHIIRNNIVHDTGKAGAAALYNSAIRLGTGSLAYNNVIYNVTSPGYGIYLTNGFAGNTDTYTREVYQNTIDDGSSNAIGSYGSPTVDVRNNIGPASPAYNIATSNSYYVNEAGANYHLVAGSAPIDVGANLTAIVPTDIEGTSRTANMPPDLGAYEFVSSGSPAPPSSDTTPPSVPVSVSGSASSATSINLTWAPSTDNVGVAGYKIYRGGSQTGSSSTTSYSDSGLSPATQYTYSVAAYDAAGNVSSQSSAAQATTQAASSGTINAASCSASDVNAAIASASTGETVFVPACSSTTWNTVVTVNKAITLQGATTCTGKGSTLSCTDSTIIAGIDSALTLSASNARVTGFTINGGGSGTGIHIPPGYTGWRIDHVHIGPNTGARGIYVDGGTGLVDHVLFETRDGGIDLEGDNAADGPYPGDYNWTQPLALGSSNDIYIEDCKFNWTSQTDGGYDFYNGGRAVFRFNDVEGATIGDHGLDSSAGRATVLQEIYDNTSAAQSFDTFTFWNTRGGTQMIFNNTTTGWGLFADLRVYRALNGYGWGNGNTCNSNSNYIDQNTGNGYACRDQVGRGPETNPANDWPSKTTTAVFSEALDPTYMWSNTIGGSSPTYATNGSGTISVSDAANDDMPNVVSEYEVLLNRDFYIQGSSFTGATGVGVGTLAARPATCTVGVAYWATDQGNWNQSGSGGQGVLYQCTATNTWTLYYTPYTYPNPLQGGSSAGSTVGPPINVNGIAQPLIP